MTNISTNIGDFFKVLFNNNNNNKDNGNNPPPGRPSGPAGEGASNDRNIRVTQGISRFKREEQKNNQTNRNILEITAKDEELKVAKKSINQQNILEEGTQLSEEVLPTLALDFDFSDQALALRAKQEGLKATEGVNPNTMGNFNMGRATILDFNLDPNNLVENPDSDPGISQQSVLIDAEFVYFLWANKAVVFSLLQTFGLNVLSGISLGVGFYICNNFVFPFFDRLLDKTKKDDKKQDTV